jgi:hypothetical protein
LHASRVTPCCMLLGHMTLNKLGQLKNSLQLLCIEPISKITFVIPVEIDF